MRHPQDNSWTMTIQLPDTNQAHLGHLQHIYQTPTRHFLDTYNTLPRTKKAHLGHLKDIKTHPPDNNFTLAYLTLPNGGRVDMEGDKSLRLALVFHLV